MEKKQNLDTPYRIEIVRSQTWRDKLIGKPPQYYARIISTWNGRTIFISERYKNEMDCIDISRRVRVNLIDAELTKTY